MAKQRQQLQILPAEKTLKKIAITSLFVYSLSLHSMDHKENWYRELLGNLGRVLNIKAERESEKNPVQANNSSTSNTTLRELQINTHIVVTSHPFRANSCSRLTSPRNTLGRSPRSASPRHGSCISPRSQQTQHTLAYKDLHVPGAESRVRITLTEITAEQLQNLDAAITSLTIAAPALPSLNGFQEITQEQIKLIIEKFPALRELNLGGVSLTDKGLELLAQAPFASRLLGLNISDNGITISGVTNYMRAFTSLTHLDISYNNIQNTGLWVLAHRPFSSRLMWLDISHTNITETEIEQQINAFSSLIRLNVLGIDLSYDTCELLADHQSLKEIACEEEALFDFSPRVL